jgi:arylsulfatase A-like enzyme
VIHPGQPGLRQQTGGAPVASLTPNTKAPLALTLNGYSTGQFGNCHEVPVWQSSPMGPFEHRHGRQ